MFISFEYIVDLHENIYIIYSDSQSWYLNFKLMT